LLGWIFQSSLFFSVFLVIEF